MRLTAFLVVATLLCHSQSLVQVFEKAVTALASGDYAAAEEGFQRVLETKPEHLDSLQNLGVVYARTGRFDRAIVVYRRALELSPGNNSVRLNLGLAYMKQGKFAAALPVFQTLASSDPRSILARDMRVLYPLVSGYLKQNRTEEAKQTVEEFLSSLPPAPAALVECKLHFENERLVEAEEQCRKTLAIAPRFPGAHLELAKVLVAQRSSESAFELNAAIREDPADSESLYGLGVALLQDGRVEEGLPYLERSMRMDPSFWGPYFQLGTAKLKRNQPEAALPLLRKATELNPESFSAFYELGRALMATGKTEEARHAMQRVRELKALELEKDAQALRKR